MKTKVMKKGWAVWLEADEADELVDAAERVAKDNPRMDGWQRRLAVRTGRDTGIRSFEYPQIRPKDIRRSPDGETYLMHIERGKDTENGVGKSRDVPIPSELERELYRFSQERGLNDDEPFFDVHEKTIQQWVKDAALLLAEETGNDDWEKVSSHDLRRYWGHTLLRRRGINPQALCQAGGWSDVDQMLTYLTELDDREVVSAFKEVKWV